MSKRHSISWDRIFAIILFAGSIFVAFDIRFSISSNHNLWSVPFTRYAIWAPGLIILVFWGLASLGLLNRVTLHVGWAISAIWHFGWLAFLIVTIFGFLGMLVTAPLFLFWLLIGGVLSLATGMKIREEERENLD